MLLPSFFYRFSRLKPDKKNPENFVYIKYLFGILPPGWGGGRMSFSLKDCDWSIYRKKKVVIDGNLDCVSKRVVRDIREQMEQSDNSEAPLKYSDKFWRRFFNCSRILQFGHKRLHIVGRQSFRYTQLTYHLAKLTKRSGQILLNYFALDYEDEKVIEINDLLNKTIAYEGQLFYDRAYYPRKHYILLGTTDCYAEWSETKIKDIVYFDRIGKKTVRLDFGNATHFAYRKLLPDVVDYLYNYFIEHGSPIKINGTIFESTWVWWKPMSWFRTETITMGEKGVNYFRPIGWRKNRVKTSFIPYQDFFFYTKKNGFFWRKIEVYGSQNIITNHYFKRKDAKKFYEILLERNPMLANRTGKRFRTFRFIPFAPKETIVIVCNKIFYYHPNINIPIMANAEDLVDLVKKRGRGFFGWLFWRHVFATYPFNNVRYDEWGFDMDGLYVSTALKYGLSINKKDYNLRENVFVVPHMWVCSASRLMRALENAKTAQRMELLFSDEEEEIYIDDDSDDPKHIFTANGVKIISVDNSIITNENDALVSDVVEPFEPSADSASLEADKFNLLTYIMEHKILVIVGAIVLFMVIMSILPENIPQYDTDYNSTVKTELDDDSQKYTNKKYLGEIADKQDSEQDELDQESEIAEPSVDNEQDVIVSEGNDMEDEIDEIEEVAPLPELSTAVFRGTFGNESVTLNLTFNGYNVQGTIISSTLGSHPYKITCTLENTSYEDMWDFNGVVDIDNNDFKKLNGVLKYNGTDYVLETRFMADDPNRTLTAKTPAN